MPVHVQLAGAGTAAELQFDHNRYDGDAPGIFGVTLVGASSLQVVGSPHRLTTRNHNFDFTNALAYLTGLVAPTAR
jgi:hypothetical protein